MKKNHSNHGIRVLESSPFLVWAVKLPFTELSRFPLLFIPSFWNMLTPGWIDDLLMVELDLLWSILDIIESEFSSGIKDL